MSADAASGGERRALPNAPTNTTRPSRTIPTDALGTEVLFMTSVMAAFTRVPRSDERVLTSCAAGAAASISASPAAAATLVYGWTVRIMIASPRSAILTRHVPRRVPEPCERVRNRAARAPDDDGNRRDDQYDQCVLHEGAG